ncbi:MAG TPA: PDZ domain-containing protein, partial [Puia sp.]|nr:PDZ domain-containing protein [Puia sp.]
KTIYLYPPPGADLKTADFSVSRLTDLVHIEGTQQHPVRNITIMGIVFTQTARTFMLVKEPLLRSDWRIYRGGAILLDRTEDIHIRDCTFYELGGNAVFLSNYNKGDTINDNHFYQLGGNAIAFVGNPACVRSPSFSYESFVPWSEMDYTPGPKGKDFPQYCAAAGNLIHDIGTIEKQVAGIEISMSFHIRAAHNTIYQTPRAGINISEGTWGGHVIEFNDVFNTVMETGDHGAFNSWGRDRYWRPERNIIDSIVAAKPGIELLDVIDPVVIRNNRFQCDHGWDIDLDDGSTNYEIYDNICLSGGLKLREGYHRTVRNNIILNNTFHPHVWLKNSHDRFVHNIVTLPYAPILMNNWGDRIDSNFFLSEDALVKARELGLDQHSSWGKWDAGSMNIAGGVGVTKKDLKAIAKKPVIRPLVTGEAGPEASGVKWLGAFFKDVRTLGEQSAAGLPDKKGALLTGLPSGSAAEKNGLQQGDVIRRLGSREIGSAGDLLQAEGHAKPGEKIGCVIFRNQSERTVVIIL